MGNRTVPDPAAASEARFNQLTVERLRSDARAATEHSIFRNDRVARVLCFVGSLRARGAISQGAAVAVVAAKRQHFSSPNGYQAAHYLPGQLLINGRFPWTLVKDAGTRLQFERLFADVEHLPANFNKADSAAEACGLKDAFARACDALISRATAQPGAALDRRAVRDAYLQVWSGAARVAFQVAIDQKSSRPHLPPLQKDAQGNILNLGERSAPSAAEWAIEEQLNVLRRYLDSLNVTPPSLSEVKMAEHERDFKP
jgi:hypothetical protein